MTRNIGRFDQFLRIIVGFALLAYTVKDGTLGPGLAGGRSLGTGLGCNCVLLVFPALYAPGNQHSAPAKFRLRQGRDRCAGRRKGGRDAA
jgi:Inner membrane protein YgaP-like, transmembrane domain